MFIALAPLPPPHTGQTIATDALLCDAKARGFNFTLINTSRGNRAGFLGISWRLAKYAAGAVRVLASKSPVYISAGANGGFLPTLVVALLSQFRSRPIVIHLHSYGIIRNPGMIIRFLFKKLGPRVHIICLCDCMFRDLQISLPGTYQTGVLNNSGLVKYDGGQAERIYSQDGIVIGHISNLTMEKGLAESINVAAKVNSLGKLKAFILAGPAETDAAIEQIERARLILGPRFCYLGPVYGREKNQFFSSIDVLIFPSRYRNEAQPLVVYEAFAYSVPVVSSDTACMKLDTALGGFALPMDEAFVSGAADRIVQISDDLPAWRALARRAFDDRISEHRLQIQALWATLGCR